LVYYQLDHLGTPIAAHNEKGEAVWTVEYEAWGRIRNKTVSDGLKPQHSFSAVSAPIPPDFTQIPPNFTQIPP